MSTTIDDSFPTLFDAEVFVAYQRMGSKMRGSIREKPCVGAEAVQFNKYGQGTLGTKDRHGLVPVMNGEHTHVSATPIDYYGGDYVDDLDEIKTNIDERSLITNALGYACGRKVDTRIIAAAEAGVAAAGAGQLIEVNSTNGFVIAKVYELFKLFNEAEVPDDGGRYVFVSPEAWNNLLAITQFSSQDYLGSDGLPWASGTTAKRWLSFVWVMHSGLTKVSTTRSCLAWHQSAIGLAVGTDIKTNFDWVPEKASHFAQARISCEAVAIENTGIVQIDCYEA